MVPKTFIKHCNHFYLFNEFPKCTLNDLKMTFGTTFLHITNFYFILEIFQIVVAKQNPMSRVQFKDFFGKIWNKVAIF
jgi:hypothetical protein